MGDVSHPTYNWGAVSVDISFWIITSVGNAWWAEWIQWRRELTSDNLTLKMDSTDTALRTSQSGYTLVYEYLCCRNSDCPGLQLPNGPDHRNPESEGAAR